MSSSSCSVVLRQWPYDCFQAHWLTADAAGAALEVVWGMSRHVQLSPALSFSHSRALSGIHHPSTRLWVWCHELKRRHFQRNRWDIPPWPLCLFATSCIRLNSWPGGQKVSVRPAWGLLSVVGVVCRHLRSCVEPSGSSVHLFGRAVLYVKISGETWPGVPEYQQSFCLTFASFRLQIRDPLCHRMPS